MKAKKLILKLLIVIFAVCCLFTITSCIDSGDGVSVWSKCNHKGVGYTLNEDGQSYRVSYVGSDEKEVTIRSKYKGKPVTRIADGAFTYSDILGGQHIVNFSKLTLPSTITHIGEYAFKNGYFDADGYNIPYDSSRKIYFNGTLEQWMNISFGSTPLYGSPALYINGVLLEKLEVPESITEIGANTFCSYNKLKEVTLHQNVCSIGEYAFGYCSLLTKVSVKPSQNTASALAEEKGAGISDKAFYNCYNLLSAAIPQGVASVDSGAFSGCAKLLEVYNLSEVQMDNFGFEAVHTSLQEESNITSFGDYMFFDGEKNYLLSYTGNSGEVTLPENFNGESYQIAAMAFYYDITLNSLAIPNGVTQIGKQAFYECKNLESVSMVAVTQISNSAFAKCEKLKSVTFGEELEELEDKAFLECKSLESVTLPQSFNSLGGSTFRECRALQTVCIYGSLTVLGDYAFGHCNSLKCVELPSCVTTIGNLAFYSCTVLEYFNFPESLKEIGDQAFRGCYAFKEIDLPEGLVSIGNYAFSHCGSLESVELPSCLTIIGDYAFNGCIALEYINFPESLKEIGNGSFEGCTALKEIELPEGLVSIGNYAFSGCTTVKSVTIPQSVKSIGRGPFSGCSSLESVAFLCKLMSMSRSILYGCNSLKSISLPRGIIWFIEISVSEFNNLQTIYYAGTMQEWQAVSKHNSVKKYCDIVCLNGTIPREANFQDEHPDQNVETT